MKYIFTYIAILICLSSCSKDDGHTCSQYTPGTDVQIGASLASYQFKQDSYWVYRNDATSQIDSQRVESAYINNWFSGGGSSSCSGGTSFHEYHMIVGSSLTNEYFRYYLLGAYFYKSPLSGGGGFSGKCIFGNPDAYAAESGMEQLEIIPFMTLNGNNLTNVKKILVKYLAGKSNNISNHDMHFYFADSIGVVKWEEIDGSTVLESWSVQSWDVIL